MLNNKERGTNNFHSLTNSVVKEKGEAKATKGSVGFSFSLTHVHGICQRIKLYNILIEVNRVELSLQSKEISRNSTKEYGIHIVFYDFYLLNW